MAKYRKKPVVIEAWQYSATPEADWPEWVQREVRAHNLRPETRTIRTLEGPLYFAPGDWIIQGVNGEIYPCKPDIFEKTYEPAEMVITVSTEHEFTEADLSAPGFIVYEPGDPRPRLDARGLAENDPIPDLATGSLSDEEIFQGTQWTPEQLASINAMAQDAAFTGLGVVEINHIPRGDFLDTEPEIDMAGQVEVALDRVRAILNQQREQIRLLREQLEAEGAHTAAANARIDEMERAKNA